MSKKAPIPDLSKPSPFRQALKERRDKSIAEGNALVMRSIPHECYCEICRSGLSVGHQCRCAVCGKEMDSQ